MGRALAWLLLCVTACTVYAGEKPGKAALRGSQDMVRMQNPFIGRTVRVPRHVAEDVKKQMNEVNALASVAQVQDLAAKAQSPSVAAPAARHAQRKPEAAPQKHGKAFDKELSEESAGLEQLEALASRNSGGGSAALGMASQLAGLMPGLSAGPAGGRARAAQHGG